MKFVYIATMLVPTILAVEQATEDSQGMQAVQKEAIGKTEALEQLIKKEARAPFISWECT